MTLTLVRVFLLSAIVVNVALQFFGDERTALFYAKHALAGPSRGAQDSWAGMSAAIDFMRAHPGQSPYEPLLLDEHLKFQYPLTSLLPFAGLDALHVRRDAIALNWLGRALLPVIALLAALVFLRARGGGESRGPRALIAPTLGAFAFTLTFYPIQIGVYSGQVQTWITVLFGLALWSWLEGAPGWAGAAIGIMAAIKPNWLLFLPWAIVRRQWRFASALTAAAIGLFAVSVFAFGFSSYSGYGGILRRMTTQGELFYANQSLNGLLHRLLGNCADSAAFAPYSRAVFVAATSATALFIGGALMLRKLRSAVSPAVDFCVAALCFTMAAPIAWDHHYGIALFIFAAMFPAMYVNRGASGRGWLVATAAAYVLISNVFPSAPCGTPAPLSLLQSLTFYGGCLLLVCLISQRGAGANAGRA